MELPWLQQTFSRLWEQHQQQRLPHALLLQGVKGLGKLTLAEALGAAVLCLDPQINGACQQCKSCQLLAAGSHPDFQYLRLEEKASMIKVDQVRQLNEFCYKTAHINERKIVVIEPAEAMNINAANALLKTLEEPPAGTLMLLVSHKPSRLLPTIKSRCQQVNFELPDMQACHEWLQQQLQNRSLVFEAEGLLLAASFAPLKALDLASSGDYETLQAWLADIKKLLLNELDALAMASSWNKKPLLPLLQALAVCLTDWIQLLSAGGGTPLLRYPQMQDVLHYIPAMTAKNLYVVLDLCQLSIKQLEAGNNPNPQLLLEHVLHNVQYCAQGFASENTLLY